MGQLATATPRGGRGNCTNGGNGGEWGSRHDSDPKRWEGELQPMGTMGGMGQLPTATPRGGRGNCNQWGEWGGMGQLATATPRGGKGNPPISNYILGDSWGS